MVRQTSRRMGSALRYFPASGQIIARRTWRGADAWLPDFRCGAVRVKLDVQPAATAFLFHSRFRVSEYVKPVGIEYRAAQGGAQLGSRGLEILLVNRSAAADHRAEAPTAQQ